MFEGIGKYAQDDVLEDVIGASADFGGNSKATLRLDYWMVQEGDLLQGLQEGVRKKKALSMTMLISDTGHRLLCLTFYQSSYQV